MHHPQDLADQAIRSAVREYHALQKRRYTIVKLTEPIQRGWRRLHVLTESAAARKDRPVLEGILKMIGTVEFHHNREFMRRRRRRGRKVLVDIEQPLQSLQDCTWIREKYFMHWSSYFRLEQRIEWDGHWHPYWIFRQPWLFELKVERNLLRYFREVDPAIETRLSEIERWLLARDGWHRFDRMKGRSSHF